MQAVLQAVNIARDLVEQFENTTRVMARMAAEASEHEADISVRRAEVERLYAAIWEQLDTAADHTRRAGRSTDAYAMIRTSPHLDRAVGVTDVKSQVTHIVHGAKHDIVHTRGTVEYNREGITSARRAISALEAVWPEIDWTPAAPQPDIDVSGGGLLGRLLRLFK